MTCYLTCLLCGVGIEILSTADAAGWSGIEEDEETLFHFVGLGPKCSGRVTVLVTRFGGQ